MSPKTWWHQHQKRRARRYLSAFPGLARQVLQESPDIALTAVQHAMDALQAANGADGRKTVEFPAMGQFLQGDRPSGITSSLPKVTPFNLRRFSEYPPARRAINTLCNPILDMPWTIEVKAPIHTGQHARVVVTSEQQARIDASINMLTNPNRSDSWRIMLEQILEDIVVGGYGTIEVGQTDDPTRPAFLWPVDGQTVRINASWKGDARDYRYAQSPTWGGYGGSYYEPIELYDDELLYFRLNPRTNTPFGFGYLEVAFNSVNAFMGAFDYATRRASNASPQYIIFLGENVDIPTVRQWQQYWELMIEGRGKVPIMGGGRAPTIQPLSGSSEDMLFLNWQEFLLRVIAMSFGISPQKLSLERDVNRNTAEQAALADWESAAPVAMVLSDLFTHKLLGQILGWTDLKFKWLVRESDALRQAQILVERYNMNSITVNEVREYYEQEPMDDEWGTLTKDQIENKAKTEYMSELPAMGGPGPVDEDEEEAEEGP